MTSERLLACVLFGLFAAIAFRREIKAAIRNSVPTSKSGAGKLAGSAPATPPPSGGGASFSDE